MKEGLKKFEGTSMENILNELQKDNFVEESPREYVIKGKPTPQQLYQLTDLDFEVSIREVDGKLILNTGTKISAYPHMDEALLDDLFEQEHESRISFHTHPLYTAEIGLLPSALDVMHQVDEKRQKQLIGTHKGLLIVTVAEELNKRTVYRLMMQHTVQELWLGNISNIIKETITPEERVQRSFLVAKALIKDLGDKINITMIPWRETNSIIEAYF